MPSLNMTVLGQVILALVLPTKQSCVLGPRYLLFFEPLTHLNSDSYDAPASWREPGPRDIAYQDSGSIGLHPLHLP